MIYSIDVITADASKLKNRGLAYAFTSSPYMITAFAGSKASEGFYQDISWRWGFGCFAIILPVVAAPLFFVLKTNLRKAKRQGVLGREKSGRTLWQSICHYVVEFDGMFCSRLCLLVLDGLTWLFLFSSIGRLPVRGWIDRLPSAILSGRLGAQRLGDRVYHRHDRGRGGSAGAIRPA